MKKDEDMDALEVIHEIIQCILSATQINISLWMEGREHMCKREVTLDERAQNIPRICQEKGLNFEQLLEVGMLSILASQMVAPKPEDHDRWWRLVRLQAEMFMGEPQRKSASGPTIKDLGGGTISFN